VLEHDALLRSGAELPDHDAPAPVLVVERRPGFPAVPHAGRQVHVVYETRVEQPAGQYPAAYAR
jgi:hypothetical protein